ncbi:MAG: class I SAM-dependent methyltransferase [Planctomycetota bacterium]
MTRSEWETLYRWEWFRREQWRPRFREQKAGKTGGSCRVFKDLLQEIDGDLALDCTCGFGLKTIVMKEMGIHIVGSDACAFAVEKARELARLEGHEIEFFTSSWAELPSRTSHRFDGIFNDALSWTLTREEFQASLVGFYEALNPGGILVFFGAEEGSPSDSESRRKLLDDLWGRRPKFSIEWTHKADDVRCTSILVREKGDMHVDGHHVFLIEDGGSQRTETATIREPMYWDWDILQGLFAEAGFASLHTRSFPGMGHGGATINLDVAAK